MSSCSFKGCKTSKRAYPNLHLFRFPVKNEKRCKAWVKNAECPEKLAHLTLKQLAARGICALHFKQSSFMNYLCQSLTRQAVPVAGYINQDLLPMLEKHMTQAEVDRILIARDPTIQEQPKRKQKFVSCDTEPMVAECSGSPVNSEQDPLDIVHDISADDGSQEGHSETKCGVDVEQRGIVTTADLVNALGKRLSGAPLTLFKMQILRSGDNAAKDEWAVEEKELALIMYYKSAPLYKYMRDRQHFVLPSDADIEHWINCTRHSSVSS